MLQGMMMFNMGQGQVVFELTCSTCCSANSCSFWTCCCLCSPWSATTAADSCPAMSRDKACWLCAACCSWARAAAASSAAAAAAGDGLRTGREEVRD
jgi:hypothetical protein